MPRREPRTAAVIGGGIVGLSVALALQRRGLVATVFDGPADRPGASWGNAGRIATELIEPLASWATLRALPRQLMTLGGPASFPPAAITEWLPFALRFVHAAAPRRFANGKQALAALLAEALPAWRRLTAAIGAPDLLREQGHIVAWETAAGAKAGRAAWRSLATGGLRWRDLTASEAALLAASLNRAPAGAVRCEGTAGVADPGAVLEALRAGLLAGGGSLQARSVTLAEARRTGVDLIVIAAGVGSRHLMREAGHDVPLIAERGYHIQAAETTWPQTLPPVTFEERAVVATGFRSGIRATSFVEFSQPDAPPDPRKWARLMAHAKALGLPFQSPVRTWFGSRPTLPDYLPAIGRSSRDPGIAYAFGHQHLGLTLGPVTGELLARLVCGDPVPPCLEMFRVERFG